MIAGTISDDLEAEKVLTEGADLIAVGHGLITDLDWVEKVKNNQNDQIEHAIDTTNLDKLALPYKLWKFLKKADGWFEIK